ncbi:DUF2851 family protein [Larkinella terrae]|uniref:DUF2851 family protein n=1 Tax=Larkinella terrae TaxID=2025311 RepID=A0A7K0EDA3_9BACT|nr:DUF2851 family protein [Larkinella terrae]MRS59755.1 DUF2851 family protein [Larkinella terrae]
MSEDFIYFLWQFQYFRTTDLRTVEGETVRVIHPGFRNPDAGPDFTQARLFIGEVEWAGTIEAHIRASDWLLHRHQFDRAYDNVILHIVWDKDPIFLKRSDGSVIPTLCLSEWADVTLLHRYQALLAESGAIPCAGRVAAVEPFRRTAMFDMTLLQRLERKASGVMTLFHRADQDWEETTYQLLATAFGFQVNAEPFGQLSRQVPLKVLHKHRDNPLQLEALLFGTAGLLTSEEPDEYETILLREYRFLATKYQLTDRKLPAYSWKWSKLRPANFPTLRLAQFVKLLTSANSIFSYLIETGDSAVLLRYLQVTPTAYWQAHYRFGKSSEKVLATLGQTAAENLIINAVVPLLTAYSHHRDLPEYRDRAVDLLEQLAAENNRVTRIWQQLKIPIRTAFDSQASIELYRNYCQMKKCLSCQIGVSLVK